MIVRITKYSVAALVVGFVLYFYTSTREVDVIVDEPAPGAAITFISVAVHADGSLSVNGERVLLDNLEGALAPMMSETALIEVSVLEDTDSMLLVQVMDVARRAGVGPANINIVQRAGAEL